MPAHLGLLSGMKNFGKAGHTYRSLNVSAMKK